MARVMRRMNMCVYGPWALVYIRTYEMMNFVARGRVRHVPRVCVWGPLRTVFWFKKATRGLRVGPKYIYIYNISCLLYTSPSPRD